MKQLITVALGAALSFGMAGKAHAAPAWCAAFPHSSDSYDLKDLSAPDVIKVIETYVRATCTPSPEAEANRAQIDAGRQAWSKKLDMSDDDWADAVDFLTLGQSDRINGQVAIHRDGSDGQVKRAWSGYDPLDQWAMITSGVGAPDDLALDRHYLVDAFGAKLSAVGRAAYVKRCIERSDGNPVEWAMCQGDIAQLDYARIAAELRANKQYTGADKMHVRLAINELKPALVAHAARVKALVAKDPGYGKMFEVAAATREDWVNRYKSDAALLGLVAAMDDARATNSRKAFAGCEDDTWVAWKAALGSIPAKAFEGMHDDRERAHRFDEDAMGPLLSNPKVYLAAVALTTCMTVGQDRTAHVDVLVRLLSSAMQRWPGFRGPRTGTEAALMTTGITLDDRDARLDYPEVHRSFAGIRQTSLTLSGGGSGVVASLKPSGKTVTVTFKQQLVKQVQCAERKTTNRINQITAGGSVIYETTCVRNETVVVDKASSPQTVNPRYLEGVKPGMDVSILEDVVVWARVKPGSPSPSMVFGVALK